ncbi:MAG TPA: 23S rRNA (pseudouridine(1915)-N(3))-methyltransferase RlmH [Coxiellaceae bacterium]|nr:23S rRNA (pseudouridine(1915)-N(3))-methyltransferase RlmH [Coxiellaceae bacterium]
MHINIITIGQRMPEWINQGYEEYASRFSHPWKVQLMELPLEKRTKQSTSHQWKEKEAEQLLAKVPEGHALIALDERGKSWDTRGLADQCERWRQGYGGLSFVIGGPDGLSPTLLKQAQAIWSLSPLTFPHPLVRVIVIEQIYRVWSLGQGHPYHR